MLNELSHNALRCKRDAGEMSSLPWKCLIDKQISKSLCPKKDKD